MILLLFGYIKFLDVLLLHSRELWPIVYTKIKTYTIYDKYNISATNVFNKNAAVITINENSSAFWKDII